MLQTRQRSLRGNLVLLFADVTIPDGGALGDREPLTKSTKRFSGPFYDLRPRQAM